MLWIVDFQIIWQHYNFEYQAAASLLLLMACLPSLYVSRPDTALAPIKCQTPTVRHAKAVQMVATRYTLRAWSDGCSFVVLKNEESALMVDLAQGLKTKPGSRHVVLLQLRFLTSVQTRPTISSALTCGALAAHTRVKAAHGTARNDVHAA